jgi:hypothetical protein
VADRLGTDPFCPSCGTEVDEDARFCPTCGRTLMLDEDGQPEAAPLSEPLPRTQADPEGESDPEPEQEPEPEPETVAIPPAPAWPPPPEPEPVVGAEPPPAKPAHVAAPPPAAPSPAAPPPAAPPPAAPPPATSPPATSSAAAPRGPAADLPITWPVTLSGWLIGAGSLAAALTLLVRLGNPINLLLFVALLAIAASVFLVDRVPTVPHQRLGILVVLMIALGIALERAAFRIQGVESIFLIAMLVAAGGALLLELGRDRPVPPLGGDG